MSVVSLAVRSVGAALRPTARALPAASTLTLAALAVALRGVRGLK